MLAIPFFPRPAYVVHSFKDINNTEVCSAYCICICQNHFELSLNIDFRHFAPLIQTIADTDLMSMCGVDSFCMCMKGRSNKNDNLTHFKYEEALYTNADVILLSAHALLKTPIELPSHPFSTSLLKLILYSHRTMK